MPGKHGSEGICASGEGAGAGTEPHEHYRVERKQAKLS